MKYQNTLTACNYSYMQLMDFNARFYSPTLGGFVQPDSLIPDLTNSQAWNRYTYVLNSPVMYIDPSGYMYLDSTSSQPIFDGNDPIFSDLSEDPEPPDDAEEETTDGSNPRKNDATIPKPNKNDTCMGAAAAGGLGIVSLAPLDVALAVVNVEVSAIPVVGPFVEVLFLVPIDLAVIDLHIAFAGLVYQGATKSCDEVRLEFLPPWGFDE